MLNFEFNAQAYRDSLQHELIPEGQYRAKITSISQRLMPDGTTILTIGYQVTHKGLSFKDTLFLNPPSHPYFNSSNRKFGDLCVSCHLNPFDVKKDENILIGCVCGIELAHKKSKDGLSVYNSVKKFLRPDETERLKEFTSATTTTTPASSTISSTAQSVDSGDAGTDSPENLPDNTAVDVDDPASWF